MSISKEAFLAAMSAWLKNKSYRVGVGEEGVNATKMKWGLRIGLGVTKLGLHALGVKLPPSQMFHPVSGGADAQKIEKALAPISSFSDCLGWSIAPMPLGNTLFAVMCADSLSPQAILERNTQILKLASDVANLGIKIKGRHGGIHLRVLLTYFNDQTFSDHMRLLMEDGTRSKSFSWIWLRTGFLSIPRRAVKWSEPPGLRILSRGVKDPLLDTDVEVILSTAQELASEISLETIAQEPVEMPVAPPLPQQPPLRVAD